MHGRLFDGHTLECFFWDGETDFSKNLKKTIANQQTVSDDEDEEEDEQNRLDEFARWIEEKNKESTEEIE